MANLNNVISQRLKKGDPSSKMAQMAEKSAAGGLTTFNGLFQVSELSPQEKKNIEEILSAYAKEGSSISQDLKALIALTSEVKAINHQATLLHGERIKKAHALFTRYKEGAFSAWLIKTYGNRQTPYNLLQYYEFYQSLPHNLREKAEEMPRQAIYSLASREGSLKEKIEFVTCYKGETKGELLIKIRSIFPLAEKDQRRENPGENALKLLEKATSILARHQTKLSARQKESLKELLSSLSSIFKSK